ncbi:MAG: virulence RhuM family protein [Phenylobacterium sp.]|nr:virulence RhuM family protein [Phenylobacterium sp.]
MQLFEDADTGDRFLVYGTEKGVRIELRYEGDALWMTRAQMADLFGRDVSVIARHIGNIFGEGELPQESNVQSVHIAHSTKPVSLYSLDVIISVGYRVSSAQATLFRRWATDVLVRFATKGFVVDVERLKNPAEQDRAAELREIIRDIRSAEANLYAEIRNICAMCQDYDPKSDSWREFYRNTQAKLCYAVTNLTPAQVIKSRANALEDNMGLQAWSGDHVRSNDVTVAKNFLRPPEIKELNRLTDILLSIFEDQLDLGRLTTMGQASEILDRNLRQLGRLVLGGGGPVSKESADQHAKTQYQRFSEQRRAEAKQRADEDYAALKDAAKGLPKPRRAKQPD